MKIKCAVCGKERDGVIVCPDCFGEPQPDPEVMRRSMEDFKAGRYQSAAEILEELRIEKEGDEVAEIDDG